MKYILVNIQKANAQSECIDYDSMTIEHLVPQKNIGQGKWDHETIGQAGNLILVSEDLNGKLKDKGFVEKKKILLENGVKLEKEIMDAADWTTEEIKDRTARMADTAYKKVWKI